ncbi:Oidioi.mRNA.OKI2018_I69.PAR.g9321.t1.cds [Oikopleura dioica]|uniref:Oidioi.mRNA.OKI2018_I69.PAR.g9321.t1.cds n=1 Tax=Oikopleura dioica TaxID=34765 RepID=A0ABN7RK33_OIKDI|nr:Oidioi.mRNA.OKI2018_I69.PAR.g9321.t1.cds [Oikopleura dioica]
MTSTYSESTLGSYYQRKDRQNDQNSQMDWESSAAAAQFESLLQRLDHFEKDNGFLREEYIEMKKTINDLKKTVENQSITIKLQQDRIAFFDEQYGKNRRISLLEHLIGANINFLSSIAAPFVASALIVRAFTKVN